MEILWIILGILAVAVLCGIAIYNRIIQLVQTRKNAFSDIDVQLKLRHDLVPNLVETVRGYAAHEASVFEKVTEARATSMRGGTLAERAQAEGMLGAAMMNLMAVAENYPALKADGSFQRLQAELSDIENKIAAARRFFNNATNEYNTVITQFPAVLVARAFNYRQEDFFEMGVDEKAVAEKPPAVSFG